MKNKNILLLAYAFPPNIAIGARRWAKFVKYLAQNGYVIHVVTAKSHLAIGNNWVNDITHENINVYYVADNQNKWLREGFVKPNDYLKRFIRKLYIIYLEYYKRGLWMDEARFMKKNVLSKASELIERFNIDNVIATGPPFNMCYYAALLKEQFPKINILCDYRDSWIDAKNYGYINMPSIVSKEEKRKERYTCEQASYLLFTYDLLKEEVKNRNSHLQPEKFIHISHAYDPDDFKPNSHLYNGKKLKVIYGGAITNDVYFTIANTFVNSLSILKKTNFDLYKKLDIQFYAQNINFEKMVNNVGLEDVIIFKKRVSEKEFFDEIEKSDLLLSILGDDWKDYITSKNINYLGFNKPILMVANEGKGTEFIRENNLGYVLNNENVDTIWSEIIHDYESGRVKFGQNKFSNYSYPFLAKKVESLFI